MFSLSPNTTSYVATVVQVAETATLVGYFLTAHSNNSYEMTIPIFFHSFGIEHPNSHSRTLATHMNCAEI